MAFLGLPIVGQIIGGLADIVKARIPDVNQRAAIEADLTKQIMAMDWGQIAGQLEINKVEASHESVFVSGWRPGVGWVCVSALGYNYVLQPLLSFTMGIYLGHTPPVLPSLSMVDLMAILSGILGLGGMRTREKLNGVSGSGQK